ncbi:hypothetical protein TESS_TESS_01115 [Tessaracoccus sp. O5.2]|uniref:type I restriction endonuclease subunit R n=1 Tax=Tessaracoccus sp. O5.2 TaxID=3157622 RepID=UPI0035E784FB
MLEDDLELLAHDYLGELGWRPVHGSELNARRASAADPVLVVDFRSALARLNPAVPATLLDQAATEILTPASQDAASENLRLHELMVHGYRGVSWLEPDGTERTPTLRLIDPDPSANDWLAARQVIVRDRDAHRRFDLVLYCNGLPVGIVELKNAGDQSATVATAHAQLATYLREFPMAFRACVVTLLSDGVVAKYGNPFAPLNHYAEWNVDDDGLPLADQAPALESLLDGVANLERFGQLMRNFTAFAEGEGRILKRTAKPHQYFAVTKAVGRTVQAVESDGKAGVVWHTQGSGKSLEMEFYTNLLLRTPRLQNPTIVVVTDRTELDGQLFDGFAASKLFPEKPEQVYTREALRTALTERNSGGILFTTLQKFGRTQQEREAGREHPLLSGRRNIVVIVDEAHRSHYDDLDGYARHLADALPNATLIAFTGTPISFTDRNTREVFGDYIDIYDLTRAVADGATVPVYYEPRLVTVGFDDGVTAEQLDAAADELTRDLDETEREQVERSVAVINSIYGAPERLRTLAADIVEHWEKRRARMYPEIEGPGKGLIVCATREIAANLYSAIVALRPDWHSDAIDGGRIKVVYSGTASDQPPISDHVRRESENKVIKKRLATAEDPLELVIVKDMMLTGYDSPPLHTLYLDRPLKGALLMQTLARVNRTFRGKSAGLLVAYAPLTDNLAHALAEYTLSDQRERPMGRDVGEAVELARALVEQLRDLVRPVNWRAKLGTPRGWMDAARLLTAWLRDPRNPGNRVAEGHATLTDRYRHLTTQLGRAWALSAGADNLADIADEVRFYVEVRAWVAKLDAAEREADGRPVPEEVARALLAVVEDSTDSRDVIDIYQMAQITPPDFDHLAPSVLEEAQASQNPQLAIEALRAALLLEAARVSGRNLVRQQTFGDRVADVINRYTNGQLTSAEVLLELWRTAEEIASEARRGEQFDPPLGTDELAVYDAVAANDSAMEVLGQPVLGQIARELVEMLRRDAKTDWTVRDDVRASIRAKIKRLLRKYKYPPDRSEEAVKLVVQQMEVLSRG